MAHDDKAFVLDQPVPAAKVEAAPGGAPPTIDQMVQMLDPQIGVILGTVLRGIIASAPGAPAVVVMNLIAWKTGNLLAQALCADLSTHLKFRTGFKEAFADGMKRAAMAQPPGQQVPPDSALSRILRKS
jgi:hypothetical protein